MKPVVLVTRKLPDAVEDRLRRDYDPILNPEDALYSSDEIIERAKGADAILPCHTEQVYRRRDRPFARKRARHCQLFCRLRPR